MMNLFKAILVLVLAVGVCSFQYTRKDECSELVYRYFESSRNGEVPLNKVLKINYETYIKYNSKANHPNDRVKTVVAMMEDKLMLSSSAVSIYKDSVDYFFVIHGAKTVVRTHPNKYLDIDKYWRFTELLQDSMLLKATSINCIGRSAANGDSIVSINIVQSNLEAAKTKIKSLRLSIRLRDLFLSESTIVYVTNNDVAEVTNKFLDNSYGDASEMPTRMRDVVLDESGKAKGALKGYIVKDLRKQR